MQLKSDDNNTPDGPDKLEQAAFWIRRTLGDYVAVTMRTSADVDQECGRSLWAWLEKTFVERGIGPLARYTIQFRRLRLRPGETLSEFEIRQCYLQARIEATGASLTPDLEQRISLYMAIDGDERFEGFRTVWWHDWETHTYQAMKACFQGELEREQT